MTIEDKEFYSKEEVQNLINKSVSNSKRRSKANWKKGFKVGASLSAAATALLTTVIIIVGNNAIDNRLQNAYYNEHGNEIVAMVGDNKQFNYNYEENQPAVYYDADKIAKHLVNENDNFDISFFETYDTVKNTGSFTDVEVRKTMNDILSWVNTFYKSNGNEESAIYTNFEDYVISLGFVDENNAADYKKYSEAFKDMIAKIQAAEYAVNQNGVEYEGFGGRK